MTEVSAVYGNFDFDYKQMSANELRSKAEKSKKASGKAMEPVMIEGRQIAKTWWGTAWCDNLEKYADYSNRVGRGKSYVRAGAVIDLKIEGGKTTARVQGSRTAPYKIEITIDPLPTERYQAVLSNLGIHIENIEALMNGDFPVEMKSLFTNTTNGLFPSPREIHFSCSCPDWAGMCKHIAAVLYGIGNRLDRDPLLFFVMRSINVSDFIKRSINEKLSNMLKNADSASPRILNDNLVGKLFEI